MNSLSVVLEFIASLEPTGWHCTAINCLMSVINVKESDKTNRSGANDLVLTPGGYRPKELVHKVEPDHVLTVQDGRVKELGSSGKVVADFGPAPPRETPEWKPVAPPGWKLPPWWFKFPWWWESVGSGWIEYAYYNNKPPGKQEQSGPIKYFTTEWIVPPAPEAQDDQVILLFPGLQNSTWILQPTLQWGETAAGGGQYWSIVSWLAPNPGQGTATSSEVVPVNTGDNLTGIVEFELEGEGNYTCWFDGYRDQTTLTANNSVIGELTQCCVVLEAWSHDPFGWLTSCTQYPTATTFQGIGVYVAEYPPPLTWTPVVVWDSCGQQVNVISSANPGSEIQLFLDP